MALFTIGARYNGVGTTHSDRMTRMKILKPPRQMKLMIECCVMTIFATRSHSRYDGVGWPHTKRRQNINMVDMMGGRTSSLAIMRCRLGMCSVVR